MKIAAAMAAFVIITGCATLTEGNASSKLVAQYAVIKVAQNDPAKAARIAEIAAQVKLYISDEESPTVDALVIAIRSQIEWSKLDPADTLLVNALLERLRTELTEYLGPDTLPEDLRLAATTVADWVIEASLLIS